MGIHSVILFGHVKALIERSPPSSIGFSYVAKLKVSAFLYSENTGDIVKLRVCFVFCLLKLGVVNVIFFEIFSIFFRFNHKFHFL